MAIADRRRALANVVYSKYRDKARRKDISWSLTKDDVYDMIYKRCYYCNSLGKNKYACFDEKHLRYNGIDRLSSHRGYTQKNTVAACGTCNYAKLQMTVTEFRSWLRRAYKHFVGHA